MRAPDAWPELRRWDDGPHSLFLRPDTGAWVVVEGAGAGILELAQRGLSPEGITQALVARYEVDRAQAESDVAAYLSQLRALGLPGPSPSSPVPPASPVPQALALHVTSRCSLACRHCYASPAAAAGPEPSPEFLVSVTEQARGLGIDSFKLTGGDPLDRPEVLGALAPAADGAEVTVLTSAVGPYAELRRLVVDYGWRLQISLDGPDAATHDWYRGEGAHARVVRNLGALAEDGLTKRVTLSVCLSRVNCRRVEEILQQALVWGVGGVLLVRVSRQGQAVANWPLLELPPGEWAEVYARLADLHARYAGRLRMTGFVADYVLGCLKHPATRGCRLGESVMVDLDGRVYPCIMMGQREHCLGDLRREALADCLAPERIAALQSACDGRLAAEAVCGACDWRMVCRGACPGWPMTQQGTMEATDDLCELRRRLFPQLILQLARGRTAEASPP